MAPVARREITPGLSGLAVPGAVPAVNGSSDPGTQIDVLTSGQLWHALPESSREALMGLGEHQPPRYGLLTALSVFRDDANLADVLRKSSRDGTSILEHLIDLAKSELSEKAANLVHERHRASPSSVKEQLITEFIRMILFEGHHEQGDIGTCVAASVQAALLRHDPARVVGEMVQLLVQEIDTPKIQNNTPQSIHQLWQGAVMDETRGDYLVVRNEAGKIVVEGGVPPPQEMNAIAQIIMWLLIIPGLLMALFAKKSERPEVSHQGMFDDEVVETLQRYFGPIEVTDAPTPAQIAALPRPCFMKLCRLDSPHMVLFDSVWCDHNGNVTHIRCLNSHGAPQKPGNPYYEGMQLNGPFFIIPATMPNVIARVFHPRITDGPANPTQPPGA